MTRTNVLFLCDDNAARSLMAEAYLNHAGRTQYRAWSAGFEPQEAADPAILSLLADAGIRAGGLHPKALAVFAAADAPRMDLVVSLCAREAPGRGVLPGSPEAVRWPVGDPALSAGLGGGERGALIDLFAEIRQLVDGFLVRSHADVVAFPAMPVSSPFSDRIAESA